MSPMLPQLKATAILVASRPRRLLDFGCGQGEMLMVYFVQPRAPPFETLGTSPNGLSESARAEVQISQPDLLPVPTRCGPIISKTVPLPDYRRGSCTDDAVDNRLLNLAASIVIICLDLLHSQGALVSYKKHKLHRDVGFRATAWSVMKG